jgi:hypothetical protein
MANANSTVTLIKDKFQATNWAISQASYLAHFLASTVSQQVEADDNVIKIESPASEGFLMVLNQLAASLEDLVGLLDECERAVNHGQK